MVIAPSTSTSIPSMLIFLRLEGVLDMGPVLPQQPDKRVPQPGQKPSLRRAGGRLFRSILFE
jgi:hypothetical protein